MRILFVVALLFTALWVFPQKPMKAGIIGFYNLENLFDTLNTPGVLDEEFTPAGANKWTGKRYLQKLDNLALGISRIGEDEGWKGGPAVLGVAEIENRSVLEDLVAHPLLKKSNYQIIHYDSPDLRGVDVALIYRPRFFRMTSSASLRLDLNNDKGERIFTRDQLVVSGVFDNEPMHFIVVHWPSRGSGEMVTRPRRNAAAALSRKIVDSLLKIDPKAKIFVMGDMNDDPTDESLQKYLRAVGNQSKLKEGDLFNAMVPLYRKGIGSLNYRDGMNLFDQIILSRALMENDFSSYQFRLARVFNHEFLRQKDGRYKGYPLRSFAGNVWQGGFSDHFPVYVVIAKKPGDSKKNLPCLLLLKVNSQHHRPVIGDGFFISRITGACFYYHRCIDKGKQFIGHEDMVDVARVGRIRPPQGAPFGDLHVGIPVSRRIVDEIEKGIFPCYHGTNFIIEISENHYRLTRHSFIQIFFDFLRSGFPAVFIVGTTAALQMKVDQDNFFRRWGMFDSHLVG